MLAFLTNVYRKKKEGNIQVSKFNRRQTNPQIEEPENGVEIIEEREEFASPPRRFNRRFPSREPEMPNDMADQLKLTKKERLFVKEFLKDYNGKQAAIRTGYSHLSASGVACALLKRPKIKTLIDLYEKDLSTRFVSTKERILKEMSLLAYSDISDYLTAEGSLKVQNIKQLPSQITRAIKKVKVFRKTIIRPGNIQHIEESIDFELYDKKAALDAMGKEIGMFKERKEVTGADGIPLMPPQSPTTIVFDFNTESTDDKQ